VQNFYAGKISRYVSSWSQLTSDYHILEWVQGVKIEFDETVVPFEVTPPNIQFPEQERVLLREALDILEGKGVIVKAEPDPEQFVSHIFPRLKKDGTCRVVLNLKLFNQAVDYYHVKMDSIQSVIEMLRPGCWMASIDLKDAYYSVPIHEEYRKYLRFFWEEQLYEFTCLPNGLSEAPRKFTKLLKVVFSHLREMGHLNSFFFDDSYLQSDTYETCSTNISDSALLLDDLGFTIHPEKSVLIPVQELVFLGFLLNSVAMTVFLTEEKVQPEDQMVQLRSF